MLRTSAIAAALLMIGATAAVASSSDPRFIKDRDAPGVDTIINNGAGSSDQPSGKGPVTPAGPAGPRQPTISDGLRAICAGTETIALLNPNASAICVALQGEEADTAVDAAAVARTLRDRLDLPRPQMSTSPQAPVKALVGLETWLWVEPAQWAPVEESASLGGTTVTVTARPVQSLWDMGEGTRACGGPGRVWQKGLGQDAATSCGFTYSHTSLREPGDKYTVSATLRYGITWTCTGDCSAGAGDLGTLDSLADTAQLEVGERQSVVIR